MINKYLYIFLILLVAGGCANRKLVKEDKKVIVPVGVDSLTAVIADSIFSRVLEVEENEREANELFEQAKNIWNLSDSLWKTNEEGLKSGRDSLRVLEQMTLAQQYIQSDRKNYKRIKKLQKKWGNLNSEVISTVSSILMFKAVNNLELAIQKNRFEVKFRLESVQYLQDIALRTNDESYILRSADEFEKIILSRKGHHSYFYKLAKIYFDLKDWNQSFENFEFAKSALRSSAIFDIKNPENYFTQPQKTPVDTSLLVNCLYFQARCKIRLYEDRPALALLREAKKITPLEENKIAFQQTIDWILWDDGNIKASEIRDYVDSLVVENKFFAAKNEYLKLLQILWTKRTNDEINWNIATIDYSRLDNKDEGLARMFKVIKHSPTDSISKAPLDTAYQRYFNTYGVMCYNLGVDYLETDLQRAYIYFSQAAEIYYKERGTAVLQLARLSTFDPKETIQLCEQAMDYIELLNTNELEMLFKLLHSSYRKLGDFTASKEWNEKWKVLNSLWFNFTLYETL